MYVCVFFFSQPNRTLPYPTHPPTHPRYERTHARIYIRAGHPEVFQGGEGGLVRGATGQAPGRADQGDAGERQLEGRGLQGVQLQDPGGPVRGRQLAPSPQGKVCLLIFLRVVAVGRPDRHTAPACRLGPAGLPAATKGRSSTKITQTKTATVAGTVGMDG